MRRALRGISRDRLARADLGIAMHRFEAKRSTSPWGVLDFAAFVVAAHRQLQRLGETDWQCHAVGVASGGDLAAVRPLTRLRATAQAPNPGRHEVLMRVTVEPIGYVSSSRTEAHDDYWDAEVSTIQLIPEYGPESLQGLADFSHVEVLFRFHKADASCVVVGARHPRENGAWPLTGIFAQRGRNRPNLLGSTACHLLRVQGTMLHVSGLDAIDGTPVLDIKPVMQEFLPRGAVRQPEWSRELMKCYWSQDGN